MAAASAKSPGLSALVVAGLLVGLVVLDTALVTVSRARGGRQVLLGGRDHLTHRLLSRLGSPRRVVAVLGTVQLAVCAVTVTVAAVEVLWILMVGSVAATVGVLLIWTLESAAWLEHDAEASALDASLLPSRGAGTLHAPASGVSIVTASPLGHEPDVRAGQSVTGRSV
jgi:hypothetical protein